ncbi:Electron transport complex protein RnfB [Coxiella-like endosymbiont]|uniref:RnfABCDGE type electron transport complex subunit B n=1 Tax=Coxiella endosymbiont of Rhipicephalus microplus TaxID=1656186 RepID=UPI000C80D945|nr:RnfABCDGE type electron transport complex subunit B [Coxiella endosymbiont of Rhipicephalus microplus]PMB54591.1 Electron transport complex protein RnfB [Coxiella-like endosymbiont]
MTTKEELINKLDDLLPQTQCGLCNYKGCRPYATAIVHNETTIDHCLPGGVNTLINIATCLGQDPTPYKDKMKTKAKMPVIACIREEECIGCTKCIQVCPTDAIIGAAKLMHTIITDACSGCERCLPVCPIDCIDIKTLPPITVEEQKQHAHKWRSRYKKRQKRLARDKIEEEHKYQKTKLANRSKETLAARQMVIQSAVARVKAKKKIP